MTRLEQIQKEFKGISGSITLYIEGHSFFYIDVDNDKLEGCKFVTASCGCCSDPINIDTSLSYELEYMDDMDFQDLVEELNKLK